jgi:D-glycero-D-manno-heptose 1,7-bisphosphate phosphatase
MQRRAIFLDRDGVLNEAVVRNRKPFAPASVDELIITDSAKVMLPIWRAQNFLLICVTNQPDVQRGWVTKASVEAINQKIAAVLQLDDFYACYHDDADVCACRKPEPGALIAAAEKHDIDLSASYMIGDRWKDVAAGKAAGCKTIFIDYGYDETHPHNADAVIFDLLAADVS